MQELTFDLPAAQKWGIRSREHSDRLASVWLRIEGGKAVLISAHAPQGKRDSTEREPFYHELVDLLSKINCHAPNVVLGDTIARLHTSRRGEEDIMEPDTFGNPAAANDPLVNQSLLTKLCYERSLLVANTCLFAPD